MKTYLLDLIPRIKRFSQNLDNKTVLLNKHWVLLDETNSVKTVFIFREKDNQLLISVDGNIEKGNWDYLGFNSILIDRSEGSFLFKHGFVDDYVLALQADGKEEYALFVNEQRFESMLKTVNKVISFLEKRYLHQSVSESLPRKYSAHSTMKRDVSHNGIRALLASGMIPEKLKREVPVYDKNFLLHSLADLDYYAKYFKNLRYPYYAALLLEKLGVKIPDDIIKDLESYALREHHRSLEDVLMAINNKDDF